MKTHALARQVGQQRRQRRLPRRVQLAALGLRRPPLRLPLLRLLRADLILNVEYERVSGGALRVLT